MKGAIQLKKAVYVLLAAALAVSILGCVSGFYNYKRRPALAVYEGSLKAPGLTGEAHVYRDQYAVPHVFADNERDLFFAAGYAQAQDRLWQMVLFRAVAEGRTAELLGKVAYPGASFKGFPIDTIAIDRSQRTMGMKFVGEAGAALLEEKRPDIYDRLLAYSEGINYYMDTHKDWDDLPVEFRILKVKPEPWRPADCLSIGRLMGFILGYNMMFELMRYGLIERYGEEIGWDLAPIHGGLGPTIVPPELLHNRLPKPRTGLPQAGRPSIGEMGYELPLSADSAFDMLFACDAIRKSINAEFPFASNNWVLGGKMTESGNAMLANDSHMVHIEPSIWYMSHLKGGGIDSFGAQVPGAPFHALGHTRDLAWAATTSIADVQDLYIETVDDAHPGMYLHKGEWKPFNVRKEKIRVRRIPFSDKFHEREVVIRQSVHGPIITDILPFPEGTPPVALRWVAWDFCRNQKVFEALITSTSVEEFMEKVRAMPASETELTNIAVSMDILMRGKSIRDFERAMEKLDMPSQNWMAADSSGNIAYIPGGLVPLRKNGIGVLPAPGESGEFDWKGFLPLMEHPHLINPGRGYILSANNEVVDMEWYPYVFSTNFDSGWRAWRIEELLQELAPIDVADMKRIQNDVYVKKAEVEVPLILAAIEEKGALEDPQVKKAYDLFKQWDYEATVDSLATPVFFRYAEEMRRNVLADHVDPEVFEKFLSESHADLIVEMHLWRSMNGQGSLLFDDVTTPEVVEDRDDMLVRSVRDAVSYLEENFGEDPAGWRWGDLHKMRFFHPMGFGPFREMSVGEWPHPGARHTLRCASPAESGRWHFKSANGTSYRTFMDMGDIENARGIFDGSISGQYLSPHYDDLHQVWVRGDHLTMTMDPEQVRAEARYHLVLSP